MFLHDDPSWGIFLSWREAGGTYKIKYKYLLNDLLTFLYHWLTRNLLRSFLPLGTDRSALMWIWILVVCVYFWKIILPSLLNLLVDSEKWECRKWELTCISSSSKYIVAQYRMLFVFTTSFKNIIYFLQRKGKHNNQSHCSCKFST